MNAKPEQILQEAITRHRRGDLAGAIAGYEAVLALSPHHISALTNLASALKSAGHTERALRRFSEALDADDTVPQIWFNYANLLRDQGRVEEAENAYRRALELDPALYTAHFNLANLLRDKDERQAAERSYRETLRLAPEFVRGHMNLGNLLRADGRADEAVAVHRLSTALAPEDADAFHNLGNALLDTDALEEARAAYQSALRLRPDHPGALQALGMVLQRLCCFDDALVCWRKLVKHSPDHLQARVNLASLCRALGKIEDAVWHYRIASKLAPEQPDVRVVLASALLDMGHIAEALELLETVVRDHPAHAEAYKLLGKAKVLQVQIDAGLEVYERALEWAPVDSKIASNLLFTSLYSDTMDAAHLTARHRELAAWIASHAGAPFVIRQTSLGDRPLRVGYLSADLYSHPVGFFIEPVLTRHDPERVRATCYSLAAKADDTTLRLRHAVPRWHECHDWSDQRLGEQIVNDGIDILVDLVGHTASNRAWLMARKPAPVQALYLGYPCTTGMAAMDWLIGDPVVSPREYHDLYSERVMMLDGCFVCFKPAPDLPQVAPLPADENGVITFGSFNHLPKVSARARALWARVLAAVPDSRLMLKALSLADAGVCEAIWADFEMRGIERERIELLPPSVPLAVHMQDYGRIDIGLDPVPYTASTTTCQALWMGVPVVTLAGRHFHQRMSASVLTYAGLRELVAAEEDEYVALAADLATEQTRLRALRAGMRARLQASALCDTSGMAARIEAAYDRLTGEVRGR